MLKIPQRALNIMISTLIVQEPSKQIKQTSCILLVADAFRKYLHYIITLKREIIFWDSLAIFFSDEYLRIY